LPTKPNALSGIHDKSLDAAYTGSLRCAHQLGVLSHGFAQERVAANQFLHVFAACRLEYLTRSKHVPHDVTIDCVL
jgi:hypothetical protein